VKYLGAFAAGAVVGYISRELAGCYSRIPGLTETVTQTFTLTESIIVRITIVESTVILQRTVSASK